MADQINPPAPSWPLSSPPLAKIESFIAHSIGASTVTGPTAVFAHYDDGPDCRATARFETDHPTHRSVVVKANGFDLLAASPTAHEIVAEHAPGQVPDLLSIGRFVGGSLLLFAEFKGETVADLRDPAILLHTARTLSEIQLKSQPAVNLPTIELTDILRLFDECLANIQNYEAAWQDEDGKLERAMGFPGPQALPFLLKLQPEILNWLRTLEQADIPLSIDHGDCHAGNAVRQPDGSILIFDWENACRSHPFFSAEKLMTSAWSLDAGKSGGPWGYIRATPTQDALREAYLELFGNHQAAFAAAMPLAVIKEMHHEMEWARQCRWPNLNPKWTAQLTNRLHQHMNQA